MRSFRTVQGIALIELAIVLVAIVSLLTIGIDLPFAIHEKTLIVQAAREGARAAATNATLDPQELVARAQDGTRRFLGSSERDPNDYLIVVSSEPVELRETGPAPFVRIVVAHRSHMKRGFFARLIPISLCGAATVRSPSRTSLPEPTEAPPC